MGKEDSLESSITGSILFIVEEGLFKFCNWIWGDTFLSSIYNSFLSLSLNDLTVSFVGLFSLHSWKMNKRLSIYLKLY